MVEVIEETDKTITKKVTADSPTEFMDIVKDFVWEELILHLEFDYQSPDCCVGIVIYSK